MGCFLFIFIDPQISDNSDNLEKLCVSAREYYPQISQITQIMIFVCPVCLFSIIYRLHRFCPSVPYVLITPVPYVFKNTCPSVPYVF